MQEMTKEQLGNLVKYAVEKSGSKRKKFIAQLGYYPDNYFDNPETISILAKKGQHPNKNFELLESGDWDDKKEYINCFALALRKIVPKKIRLKEIPEGFPTRHKIEDMMSGKCKNLSDYKQFLLQICLLPDRPPKKSHKKYIGGGFKKKHDPWMIVKENRYTRTDYNSDFEYGITDT